MTGADLCELYSALWPVDGVSICGPDELLQQVLNVPAQPLVFLLQVKHLVHQQQHYPQRNVIIHLDTQTNNKERKKLQGKKGNETPTTRHNPQTHVVIKLSRDSTVFRVDVRLGEEWRHLGGKNKHWIVRGQRETNLSEQWWQRGGLWNIYTFTLIKKEKLKLLCFPLLGCYVLAPCDGVTLSMDCLMSWPSLSDMRPMLSETLVMPSARLSGRAFTALDTFLMELLRGFTNVSICWVDNTKEDHVRYKTS